jgi:carnitine-CoA ligase
MGDLALLNAAARTLPLRRVLDVAVAGSATVTVGPETRTWAELSEDALALAASMRSYGVGPGERVATIMTDRIASLQVAFATAALGALWVPLGPFLRGQFLAHQLKTAGPALLLADAPGVTESAPYVAEVPELREVVHLDDDRLRLGGRGAEPVRDGRMRCAILFTSGTTGPPKGCVVSQAYFVKTAECYRSTLAVTAADVVFTAFPLFHGAGLAVAMMAAAAGASFHHPGGFSATRYMHDAAAAGATIAIGTGGMATALMAQPRAPSDRAHALRVAEWVPLTAAGQHEFAERFGVTVYGEHYGQTECMTATQTPLADACNTGTAGRASALVEVAILDSDGALLPAGEVGEIALRPRTPGAIFDGYWRDPAATLAAWDGLWHHTGDAGMLDAEGVLTFVDRRSDSLRRRGENISSLQLEAAIAAHPRIAEVAVHAVPSAMTEDDIRACLILVPGATLDPDELFAFLAHAVPYYAVPRYVEIVQDFPRTANGKVRKDQLRARGLTDDTWDFDALGLAVEKDARRPTITG